MTRASRIPVLWLCGPAGVGKSTVSWQLYTGLASAGVPVAFADTDQLAMCYPAPPGDPGRQHIKALNFRAVLANMRSAGARCAIANGVLDPVGLDRELLPDADVTFCRLRARGDEVVRRFIARNGQRDDTGELLRQVSDEIRLMDQSSFADVCVDTTDVPASDVAALVRAACRDWPGFTGDLPDPGGQSPARRYPPASGRVVFIDGPAGVGKSTIGFSFYQDCLQAGLTAGYVDLRQIGFLRPASGSDPGNQRLRAGNLAAIWRSYQAAGATQLIATGPVGGQADFAVYAEALAGAEVTLVRLRAGRDELTRRIMSRGTGGSWPEPGDPLDGQPACVLARVARQAGRDAARDGGASGRLDPAGLAIDTTGRSADESAGLIADALGWPAVADCPDRRNQQR